MSKLKEWPKTVPAAVGRECCLLYDEDVSCEAMFRALESHPGVQSLINDIRSFAFPKLTPRDLSSSSSYEMLFDRGVNSKSEELALAWKERGNRHYQKREFSAAIRCYNQVCLNPVSHPFMSIIFLTIKPGYRKR